MKIPLNENPPACAGGFLHGLRSRPSSNSQPAFLTYSSRIFSAIAVAFSIA